jgi:2'-5' RNA ligase
MAGSHHASPVGARRGGLIVPVPEAEPILQAWRARLGPTTEPGVPAHVTLLFPFPPLAGLSAADQADLAAMFEAQPALDVSFPSVGLFPDVVYLEPVPADWFVQATQALSTRFGLLPYGGLHSHVIPHLTVARHADRAVLAHVAQQLAPSLPISTRVQEVWLMEESAEGVWAHTATFPLRAEQPASAGAG